MMNPDLYETGSSGGDSTPQLDERGVDHSDKDSDNRSVGDGLSPPPSLIALLELAREDGVDAQSVSHIKLVSGNEVGISIAPAGDGLEVDLEAYQYLGEGEQETLCYLFRVRDSEGRLLRYRAEILLAATSDGVIIQHTKGQPVDLDPWLVNKEPSPMPIVREKDSAPPPTTAPMKSEEAKSVSQQKAEGVEDIELPSSKSTFIDLEDNHCTFSLSDFPFQDESGRPLEWVQITRVPTWGTLSISDSELLAGQDISRDLLDSGGLSFYMEGAPPEPEKIEFYFRVSNGVALSREHRFTLNIPVVADAGLDDYVDNSEEVPDVQAAPDAGLDDHVDNSEEVPDVQAAPDAGLDDYVDNSEEVPDVQAAPDAGLDDHVDNSEEVPDVQAAPDAGLDDYVDNSEEVPDVQAAPDAGLDDYVDNSEEVPDVQADPDAGLDDYVDNFEEVPDVQAAPDAGLDDYVDNSEEVPDVQAAPDAGLDDHVDNSEEVPDVQAAPDAGLDDYVDNSEEVPDVQAAPDAGLDDHVNNFEEVPDVQAAPDAEEQEVFSPPSVEPEEDETVPGSPGLQDSMEGFEENTLVIFIDRDFSAHHFESIEIASLPQRGDLLYNGSSVDIEGFRVSRTDLLAGRLKFHPMVSELFEGTAGFDYRVVDGGLESEVQRFVYGTQADSGSTGAPKADETAEDKTVKDEHNKTLDISGCFTASDFGGEEPQFEHHVCEGLFGTLSVHRDGAWEYCAPAGQAAFQSLGQNEHLIETIEVESLEGETCQLMILIKGMDHEVVIAGSKCL